MKKLIFSLAALLLVCATAFSQKTNTDIYQTILRSKEINHTFFGINNPNLIFPGQILTFLYEDGTEVPVIVEKGDSQWIIVRDKLTKSKHQTGTSADLPEPKKGVSQQVTEKILGLPLWGLILFLLIMIAFFSFVIYILRQKFSDVDPVTAGEPQVPGGVSDAMVHKRIEDLAIEQFPGATLVIKIARRGLLFGKANVYYANRKNPKKVNLKKIHAYEGEISVNGHPETIYCLQGCGNDARRGDYIKGKGLTFIPDVVVNQDGSTVEIPKMAPVLVPVVKTETVSQTSEVKTDPTTQVVATFQGSETHQQRMKVLSIVENQTLKGEIHEVTIDSSLDNFGVTIKYKIVQNQNNKNQNANEKTN